MHGPLSMLVLALLVTGCGSVSAVSPLTSPSATLSPGVIPWVDEPGVLANPSYEPTPPPPTAADAHCTAQQLEAKDDLQRSGAALGNDANTLSITNTSDNPCTLEGYPTSLSGAREDGIEHAFTLQQGTYFDQQLTARPINLPPGRTAYLIIGTNEACVENIPTPDAHPPITHVTIGILGGGSVQSEANFGADCPPIDVSSFGQYRLGDPGYVPTTDQVVISPFPGLTATIGLPEPGGPVGPITFTVTLTNHGTDPVDLEPCPTFEVGFYDTAPHDRDVVLNCGAVPTLDPGEPATFEMHLPQPTLGDRQNVVKVFWSLPVAGLEVGGAIAYAAPEPTPTP